MAQATDRTAPARIPDGIPCSSGVRVMRIVGGRPRPAYGGLGAACPEHRTRPARHHIRSFVRSRPEASTTAFTLGDMPAASDGHESPHSSASAHLFDYRHAACSDQPAKPNPANAGTVHDVKLARLFDYGRYSTTALLSQLSSAALTLRPGTPSGASEPPASPPQNRPPRDT